jgi:hypothetical protein
VFADIEKVVQNMAAEYLKDPLAQRLHRRHMEQFPVVVAQLKRLVGMRQ